jgi:Flp pilus assembly pilin Flp
MTDYLMVLCRSVYYRCRSDRGASLVEYALLVGLIALVCIVGVAALGTKTSKPFNSINSGL